MLTFYQQETRRLLNDQSFALFNDFDLRVYINQARRQIALDSEVIRQPAQLLTVAAQQAYPFSAATFIPSPATVAGIGSIVLIRSARIGLANGFQRLEIRPWEWFETYYLSSGVPKTGQPKILAQQLLGAANGTLWFSPIPDFEYTITLMPVCLPIDLVNDATDEALPQPWQDAVCYYAAYVAWLTKGDKEKAADLWAQYSNFQMRSNKFATGTRLPQNSPLFNSSQSPALSPSPSQNRGGAG